MLNQCQNRLRAFQEFVSFGVSSVQNVAAFGSTSQAVQAKGDPALTQLEFLRFNQFAPTQHWVNQIIFYPRVTNASRQEWEKQVKYVMQQLVVINGSFALIPQPYDLEDYFPLQFFAPFTSATAVLTGLDVHVAPSLSAEINASVETASISFSGIQTLDTGDNGVIVTLPLFVNSNQNADVFKLPANTSLPDNAGVYPPPFDQRWAQLTGVVQAVLRMPALLKASIGTLEQLPIQVTLLDHHAFPTVTFIANFGQLRLQCDG
jgi:hypothetical protein